VEFVRKRDGETVQKYDRDKIERAVRRAFQSTQAGVDEGVLSDIVSWVEVAAGQAAKNGCVDIESIQDLIEVRLMSCGYPSVAKHYITYRHEHAQRRAKRKKPDSQAIADFIHTSTYAKHLPDQKRRETLNETCDRLEEFYLRQAGSDDANVKAKIKEAMRAMRDLKIIGSSRLKQFAGHAAEKNNARGFNCTGTYVDRIEVFPQVFWLLLSGCGVGYSVQWRHVERLPALGWVDRKDVRHHVVEDTIEGWADAAAAMLQSFVAGYHVEFAYHLIRPEGTPLRTSGGKAPGHIPLKTALERVRAVLQGAQGRKMRPVECHDILCHFADAVVSGGIRRAAMIALFSVDDGEMMMAKTGDWFDTNPQRARSNNSVVLLRGGTSWEQYRRIFDHTRQYGEPGIFWTDSFDYLCNPCAEIQWETKIKVTKDNAVDIQKWAERRGFCLPSDLGLGQEYSTIGFCNLSEVNVAKISTKEEFYAACRHAAVLGTVQATMTLFPYLDWAAAYLAERDALLGVSLTGIMDNPAIGLNPEVLREGAAEVRRANEEMARALGINSAARATCVKPSGTASLALGCIGSGIHPHHARRYFRRVRRTVTDPVHQHFKKHNPHMVTPENETTDIVTFPVESSPDAVVNDSMTAEQFLDAVKLVYANWVIPGTAPRSPNGLHHNVSNTVQVKDDEWDTVRDKVWEDSHSFAGVSFLSEIGDKVYANAPREAVVTESDEMYYRELIKYYTPVDWTRYREESDETDFQAETACGGGSCEV